MKIPLACVAMPLLLAGCASGTRIDIPRPTTETACVSMETTCVPAGVATKSGVQVETRGQDTVVTWLGTGRTLTVKGRTGYTGSVGLEHADLRLGDARIRIEESRVDVETPFGRAVRRGSWRASDLTVTLFPIVFIEGR